jgi:hypothetical protein
MPELEVKRIQARALSPDPQPHTGIRKTARIASAENIQAVQHPPPRLFALVFIVPVSHQGPGRRPTSA